MGAYKIHKDYIYLTKNEGERLKEKRKSLALFIEEVAKRIGMNSCSFSMIERKGGRISQSILDKLNKYYKYYENNVNR